MKQKKNYCQIIIQTIMTKKSKPLLTRMSTMIHTMMRIIIQRIMTIWRIKSADTMKKTTMMTTMITGIMATIITKEVITLN